MKYSGFIRRIVAVSISAGATEAAIGSQALVAQQVNDQKITVSGIVTDITGEPVIGAGVFLWLGGRQSVGLALFRVDGCHYVGDVCCEER